MPSPACKRTRSSGGNSRTMSDDCDDDSPGRKKVRDLPHFAMPSLNHCELAPTEPSHLRLHMKCEMKTPRAVHVTSQNVQLNDLCTLRPMTYNAHQRYLRRAGNHYLTERKRNKKLRALEDEQVYFASLFEAAERAKQAPDAFFRGRYDHYYTGGNLATVPLLGDECVLHAEGVKLGELAISRVQTLAEQLQLCVDKHAFEPNSEILQVLPLQRQDFGAFAVRQRNKISLCCILPGDDLGNTRTRLEVYSEFLASTPFISLAQSSQKNESFVLSNLKQDLRLFDVLPSGPEMMSVYNVSAERKNQSWNILQNWHDGTYFYANRKNLYRLDTRVPPNGEHLQRLCASSSGRLANCDQISMITASRQHDQRLYVGTSHHYYCLDVRQIGSTLNGSQAIACWTHQMQQPPMFADTYAIDGYEYLALASARADELLVCELSPAEHVENNILLSDNYCSYALPYQPPTLQEAYEDAMLHGDCLSSGRNFKYRLKSCTTGLRFHVTDDQQPLLLTANSLGDVFAREFVPNMELKDSYGTLERTGAYSRLAIAAYETEVVRNAEAPLYYTTLPELPHLRNELLKLQRTGDTIDPAQEYPEEPVRIPGDEPLEHFKGVLDEQLLSAWDLDFELDVADSNTLNHLDSILATTTRINPVQSWIDGMYSQDATDPGEDTEPVVKENNIVPDSHSILAVPEHEQAEQEQQLADTLPPTQPRTTPARKKGRVKGF